jgi:regulator of cell morphogenesis and NO signaling
MSLNMKEFQMTNRHIEKAAQLAPIIERVHGAHHPELAQVREITDKLQRSDNTTTTMSLFQKLRTVTADYTIPHDVCEAFEATYRALERADKQLTAS